MQQQQQPQTGQQQSRRDSNDYSGPSNRRNLQQASLFTPIPAMNAIPGSPNHQHHHFGSPPGIYSDLISPPYLQSHMGKALGGVQQLHGGHVGQRSQHHHAGAGKHAQNLNVISGTGGGALGGLYDRSASHTPNAPSQVGAPPRSRLLEDFRNNRYGLMGFCTDVTWFNLGVGRWIEGSIALLMMEMFPLAMNRSID